MLTLCFGLFPSGVASANPPPPSHSLTLCVKYTLTPPDFVPLSGHSQISSALPLDLVPAIPNHGIFLPRYSVSVLWTRPNNLRLAGLWLSKPPNKGCPSDGLLPEQKPNIPISATCSSASSLHRLCGGKFTSSATYMLCIATRYGISADLALNYAGYWVATDMK